MVERHLTRELQFERFFSRLCGALANVPDAEVESTIKLWLHRLAMFLGLDHGEVSQGLSVRHVRSPWLAEQGNGSKIIRFEGACQGRPTRASAESRHVTPRRLKSHLVLPLIVNGAKLGELAFGSVRRHRRWPDVLVRRLQLVAHVFGNTLARKQARQRLGEHVAFERLVANVARTFVNIAASEVDEEVNQGLRCLAECLRVDEISLGRVSEDGTLAVRCRVPRQGACRESTIVALPWYVEALRARRIVVANSPQEVGFVVVDGLAEQTRLSHHGSGDRSCSSPFPPSEIVLDHGREVECPGFQALLSVPLMTEDRLCGTITAVSFDRPREWTVWELQQLWLVGDIMMGALARSEIEGKARRHGDELASGAQVAALGELTAALAHELNQPLTAIRMNAQTTRRLLATGCEFELGDILADIVTDATRAGELIGRLRNLLHRHELEKAQLDLNRVIEDARRMAEAETHPRGARLDFVLASDLPNIQGDGMQLQQVLLNLVRNAAEAMSESVEDPQVIVRTGTTAPEQVTVSVEDTGPPVDDATFEKMFIPFRTTKPDGLGMGLAISRSIIEAHGGRLWAERRPGTGLAVRFSLPAARIRPCGGAKGWPNREESVVVSRSIAQAHGADSAPGADRNMGSRYSSRVRGREAEAP